MLRIVFYLLLIFVTYLSLRTRTHGLNLEVNDKFGHGLAYFVLMVNGGLAFGKRRYFYIAGGLFAFGLLIEFLQGMIPGRFSSFFDLVANSTGIVFGLAILFIFGQSILQLFKRIKLLR